MGVVCVCEGEGGGGCPHDVRATSHLFRIAGHQRRLGRIRRDTSTCRLCHRLCLGPWLLHLTHVWAAAGCVCVPWVGKEGGWGMGALHE